MSKLKVTEDKSSEEASKPKDWWGMDEGKGWIAEDFDELPTDIMAAFYDEDENERLNYDKGEHARGEVAAEQTD